VALADSEEDVGGRDSDLEVELEKGCASVSLVSRTDPTLHEVRGRGRGDSLGQESQDPSGH
jgi:hypothetical protein